MGNNQWIIRGRIITSVEAIWFWAGFQDISYHRTASQLISQREAARTAPNFAQPIILAYGTCLSIRNLPTRKQPCLLGQFRFTGRTLFRTCPLALLA